MSEESVSDCCNSSYHPSRENPHQGQTVYYICGKCGKPCDVKQQTKEQTR